MKDKIFITSGKKYIDIDGYAGIFAYRELLRSLGYNAYAFTSAITNESVPEFILNMGFKFDNQKVDEKTKFIILDTSNPNFLADYIKQDKIIEIIDHHSGYEEYWDKFNIVKQIETIGSVCTLIFEKIIKNNNQKILTTNLCKLLIAGILDNTLNLKSNNTTLRDLKAYEELMKFGNVNADFANIYFEACYNDSFENIEENIKRSIKIEKTGDILPEALGQLIFIKRESIFKNIDKINRSFKNFNEWMCNAICLEDGKSYLFCSDKFVRERLSLLFDGISKDNCFILNNCTLRKEIMKKAQNFNNGNL